MTRQEGVAREELRGRLGVWALVLIFSAAGQECLLWMPGCWEIDQLAFSFATFIEGSTLKHQPPRGPTFFATPRVIAGVAVFLEECWS